MEKLPLLILTGPTAVGKTNLSISLAKAVNGEIISADSMQVYRRMDIGTAKIKKEEMCGVTHHLIDICEPTEDYNVVRFATEAKWSSISLLRFKRFPIIITANTGTVALRLNKKLSIKILPFLQNALEHLVNFFIKL